MIIVKVITRVGPLILELKRDDRKTLEAVCKKIEMSERPIINLTKFCKTKDDMPVLINRDNICFVLSEKKSEIVTLKKNIQVPDQPNLN